ncbi:O-antigen ligase family protein [Candidatus Bipolaricaulota bacterium]|nr:O-antigen ligase family protein [Candidatus Bipolaricaulota bacterium]
MKSESCGKLERIQIAAIAVFVFVLPLFMWPGLTDYNYAKCIASLVLIPLLLILWGVTAWRRPSWIIRVPWVLVPVAGLIVAAGLSVIQATTSLVVLQSSVLLICFVLVLWMVVNVVRDPQHVRWVLSALLISGTLAALYGALQYAGALPGPPGTSGVGAILSTMGNRNHLGGFLLYLFYPGIILLVQTNSRVRKIAILLALMFILAMMMLVNQTSVRIAFPLVMIAFFVGQWIFRAQQPLRANRWWLATLVGFSLALLLLPLVLSQPSKQSAPISDGSFIQTLWERNSGAVRAQDWWIGAEMLADHPATGAGLGHYKLNFIASKADFLATNRGQTFIDYIPRASQAHNEYVQVGAELGIIGLVMLVASLGALAVSLWVRLRRSSEDNRLALLFLTMGILAFLAHSLVSFPAHVVGSSLEFVVFCGLALAAAYGTPACFTWRLSGWKAKGLHVALIAFGITVSSLAVADARANWLMERGIDQVEAGLFAAAEISLEHSLSVDFAPRQTYYYLAVAQIQLGKLNEAQESLEMCMTRFIDEASLLNYANLLVNTGQSKAAFEPLELLLASHPRSEIQRRATYLRALALSETGNPDVAIAQIQELLANNPTYETPYIGLGSIYQSLGRNDEAHSAYEAGLALVEKALASAREKMITGASLVESPKLAEIQATIDKLILERATLLERLRTLPQDDSP